MNKKLLIRKILMILASILLMIMIIVQPIHYFDGTLNWGIFFASLVVITTLFLIAHIVPKLSIVSFMIDIHEANQNQDEQLEDQESYLFDTSIVLSCPKRLISRLKKSLG